MLESREAFGGFNLNLIKYRQISGVNKYLEDLLTNNSISKITPPARTEQMSATLIDNIFFNYHEYHMATYIFGFLNNLQKSSLLEISYKISLIQMMTK